MEENSPTNLAAGLAQHEAAVYRFFRRMGAQPADAADLAQATFLEALRGVERFRGESTVRTWLLGIARNVFRSWLRRKGSDVALDEELEWGGSDDSEALAVRDALSRLDTDDQEILVLRYVEGLPSKELAAMYGISDDAARQRVARAADLFRELWRSSQ